MWEVARNPLFSVNQTELLESVHWYYRRSAHGHSASGAVCSDSWYRRVCFVSARYEAWKVRYLLSRTTNHAGCCL